MTSRVLFGGAMKISIPSSFDDVSTFRQVPDTQEVFAEAQSDRSVIVELLELSDSVSDDMCARFYFDDLAEAASATGTEVMQSGELDSTQMPLIMLEVPKFFCFGQHHVSKFKDGAGAENLVDVYMAVLRLKSCQMDVLIIFNAPRVFAKSSSSQSCQLKDSIENLAIMNAVLNSFEINDLASIGLS